MDALVGGDVPEPGDVGLREGRVDLTGPAVGAGRLRGEHDLQRVVGVLGPVDGLRPLLDALDEHPDLFPTLASMIEHVSFMLGRDVDHQLKTDLLFISEKFLEHSVDVVDFDEGWRSFMRSYLASIEHLVGTQAMIKASRVSDTSSVPSSFLEELEELRTQVETLSADKVSLKSELNQQIAESNALRSLPGSAGSMLRVANGAVCWLELASDDVAYYCCVFVDCMISIGPGRPLCRVSYICPSLFISTDASWRVVNMLCSLELRQMPGTRNIIVTCTVQSSRGFDEKAPSVVWQKR